MLLFTFYKRSEIAIFMVGFEKTEDSKGIFRNRFEEQTMQWKNPKIQTMIYKSLEHH